MTANLMFSLVAGRYALDITTTWKYTARNAWQSPACSPPNASAPLLRTPHCAIEAFTTDRQGNRQSALFMWKSLVMYIRR